MTESPQIKFEGGGWYRTIKKGSVTVGDINPIHGAGTSVVGYKVFDRSTRQDVLSSCPTMNQAKAFAEYYFGKEVQS
jgi:hypothetical protein